MCVALGCKAICVSLWGQGYMCVALGGMLMCVLL